VSDERMLGSGEFVEKLLGETERRPLEPRRVRPEERERFLSRLASKILREFGLREGELISGSRRREVVAARYALGCAAVSAGVPAAAVGRFANVRMQSVLRGVERGKELLKNRGLDIDRLLKQCE